MNIVKTLFVPGFPAADTYKRCLAAAEANNGLKAKSYYGIGITTRSKGVFA